MTNEPDSVESASSSAVFDIRKLAGMIGNDPDMLVQFANDYRQILCEHHKQICDALAASDLSSSADLAHRLKSSSKAMGAFELADYCELIEQGGKSNEVTEFEQLAQQFSERVQPVLDAIDAYLEETTNS